MWTPFLVDGNLFGRWILEADSFWGAVVDEWDNPRYLVSIIIHLSTLQARWKLWHISKIFLEICPERTPIWKKSQINAQENMKISMIFLEFYPERTTFRKKSNKNSFEESFFILTSAILKVPSFIKDSFECHSNQFIGLIYMSINEIALSLVSNVCINFIWLCSQTKLMHTLLTSEIAILETLNQFY